MTDDGQIPAQVRELIRERLHSIEELEILLWLRVQATATTADTLGRELKLSESTVKFALERLVANRLIELSPTTGAFSYAPEAAVRAVVDELAEAYEAYRVEMLVMISQNAIGRVRHSAIKTFSEAFRLRGDKKDG